MRRSIELTSVEIEEGSDGVYGVLLDLSEVSLAKWYSELALLREKIAKTLSLRVAEGSDRRVAVLSTGVPEKLDSQIYRTPDGVLELVLTQNELGYVMSSSLQAYVNRWRYVDHIDLELIGAGETGSDVTIYFR